MLLPKRVKHRKQHRGRMTGVATRGNKVTYGEYGLMTTEPAWITAPKIEAARNTMNRYHKRGLRFSPTSPLPLVLPIPEWVKVKVTWTTG